jgi:release factor glutamine methyltransferase
MADEVVARLRAAGCVFAEEEARLLGEEAATAEDLEALLRRRVAGEPLEHVLGWAWFCGLRVVVEPGVFVPRRRTELLVREAGSAAGPAAVVVDLCCGSGAVAAAVATAVPGASVYAADLDPVCVRCARRNLPPATVYEGDLYDALPGDLRGRVDLLTCNAPYVPTAAIAFMPPEARDHEPGLALDGGADGTDLHRRVAAGAPEWLVSGGLLLVETGRRQAVLTAAAMEEQGLSARVVCDDHLDATVVIGRRR